MSDKPHLSKTQLEMVGKCPEQYRRRYLEGDKVPPGIAAIKGRSLHGGGIKGNFRQKLKSRVDLPTNDIVGMTVAEFEREAASGYVLTNEEMKTGNKIVLASAKDDAVNMAIFYASEQAPEYQPIMVEARERLELPGSRDIVGVLDIAAEGDKIVDFKTTAKKKQQAEADESIQLSIYQGIYRKVTGRIPLELVLDTQVKTKTLHYRQRLVTHRTPADFAALAARVNSFTALIDAGIFPPAPVGAWWCSPQWCGYWHTCKYVNSERKAAAESENGQ